MDRRRFLMMANLAALRPGPGQAADKQIVFAPMAMPESLDSLATPTQATRTAALAVYETLYGTDAHMNPMSQMVQSHRVEDSGRHWIIQLRSGQRFHDGAKVTAADCVASLRRWMKRDLIGQVLAERLTAMDATAEDTLTLRLSKPLFAIPLILGKSQPSPPVIMPARLARTDPATPVSEVTGSGPFRLEPGAWKGDEGFALSRFDDYASRIEASQFTGGRRVVLVRRVIWRAVSDPIKALLDGTVDWAESVPPDGSGLSGNPYFSMGRMDEVGFYASVRLNAGAGPTANSRLRRAILAAIDQTAVMESVFNTDIEAYKASAGIFRPDSLLVTEAGRNHTGGRFSRRALRGLVTEAGYKGEPLTLLIPTGDPVHTALTAAVATQLRDIGLTVEERALPARVLAAALRDPDDTSLNDWSAVCESVSGADHDDAMGLRTGKALGAGGSDDPKASQLRGGIMDAANDQTKRALAARLQEQIYMTAPFVPLGQWFPTSAWSKTLSGLQKGLCPVFWDVARA